jgi:hypothetical protein
MIWLHFIPITVLTIFYLLLKRLPERISNDLQADANVNEAYRIINNKIKIKDR